MPYTYQDTLFFLHDRDAKENPREQPPEVFSAPVDEFFSGKFQATLAGCLRGEVHELAFDEAIRQFSSHMASPVSGAAFWHDVALSDAVIHFFDELTRGACDEGGRAWRWKLAGALSRLADTRAGIASLSSVPAERLDVFYSFLFRYCTPYPQLWRLLEEISYAPALLSGYEVSFLAAGRMLMLALEEGLRGIPAEAPPGPRSVSQSAPSPAELLRTQFSHFPAAMSAVENASASSSEAYGLLLSTGDHGLIEPFSRLLDAASLCSAAESRLGLATEAQGVPRPYFIPDSCLQALCDFVTKTIMFDENSACVFAIAPIPQATVRLLHDPSPSARAAAVRALAAICSMNSAVDSLWNIFSDSRELLPLLDGLKAMLGYADSSVRQAATQCLLRMIDGPFRAKRAMLASAMRDPAVLRRNADSREFALLQALVASSAPIDTEAGDPADEDGHAL